MGPGDLKMSWAQPESGGRPGWYQEEARTKAPLCSRQLSPIKSQHRGSPRVFPYDKPKSASWGGHCPHVAGQAVALELHATLKANEELKAWNARVPNPMVGLARLGSWEQEAEEGQ